MSLLNIFNIAGSAMSAQDQKINIISSNIANTDTLINKNGHFYPYLAQKIVFALDAPNGEKIGGVKISHIYDDISSLKKVYEPNNPMANKQGYVTKSNINPVTETIKSISASRNYQANIEVLKTVKSMIMKTLTIGE